MTATPPSHWRRAQISYYAALLHRLSGIVLACFLPVHFLTLGLALEGAAEFDAWLAYTDHPLVKFGEWALVVLLTLHLGLGVRVLLIETIAQKTAKPMHSLRVGWIVCAVLFALMLGVLFLALVW